MVFSARPSDRCVRVSPWGTSPFLLSPLIGYERAADTAKLAVETGKPIIEVVEEKKYLSKKEIESVLDPTKMIEPEKRKKES